MPKLTQRCLGPQTACTYKRCMGLACMHSTYTPRAAGTFFLTVGMTAFLTARSRYCAPCRMPCSAATTDAAVARTPEETSLLHRSMAVSLHLAAVCSVHTECTSVAKVCMTKRYMQVMVAGDIVQQVWCGCPSHGKMWQKFWLNVSKTGLDGKTLLW